MWFFLAFCLSCSQPNDRSNVDAIDDRWAAKEGILSIQDYPLSGLPLQDVLSQQKSNSLRILHLERTELVINDILNLVRASSVQKLKILSLKHNPIENRGVELIANSNMMKTLRELNLHSTSISNRGLSHLINNKNFNVKKLVLSNNSFHSSIIETLSNNKTVKYIDLSNCKLTDGASALYLSRTSAKTVKLNQNDIGFPPEISPTVTELHLNESRLDDTQLLAFSKIEAKGLKILSLGRVYITNDTLIALTHAPWFKQLESLAFNPKNQSDEEIEAFSKAYGKHRWLKIVTPPIPSPKLENDTAEEEK